MYSFDHVLFQILHMYAVWRDLFVELVQDTGQILSKSLHFSVSALVLSVEKRGLLIILEMILKQGIALLYALWSDGLHSRFQSSSVLSNSCLEGKFQDMGHPFGCQWRRKFWWRTRIFFIAPVLHSSCSLELLLLLVRTFCQKENFSLL
jgi:hypothetical protein